MKSLTVTDAVRNFSEYVNQVVYRQESFLLHKGKKPVAELRPVPTGRRLGDLPSLLESLPELTAQESTRFLRDVDRARAKLGGFPGKDPWAS